MDFKKFDWSFKSIAKIIGLVVGAIIVLTIVISLISLSFKTVFYGGNNYRYDNYGQELAYDGMEKSASIRSLNQQIVIPPQPGYSTGSDAEDFEIREHTASIQTRKLNETCKKISDLKKLDFIVFENSSEEKKSCNYNFKVTNANEDTVVSIIKEFIVYVFLKRFLPPFS